MAVENGSSFIIENAFEFLVAVTISYVMIYLYLIINVLSFVNEV